VASEADTRANFIDPALLAAGWGKHQIIREYYFTDGRKLAGNQRAGRCFVDYLLYTENQHLATIEAKKQSAHPTQGLQQAMAYAQKLSIRFIYSTNGEKIYEFDLESGKGEYVEGYPGPDELLARYAGKSSDLSRELRNIPFHLEAGKRRSRIVDHFDALPERTRTLKASTQEKINDLKASLLDAAFRGPL